MRARHAHATWPFVCPRLVAHLWPTHEATIVHFFKYGPPTPPHALPVGCPDRGGPRPDRPDRGAPRGRGLVTKYYREELYKHIHIGRIRPHSGERSCSPAASRQLLPLCKQCLIDTGRLLKCSLCTLLPTFHRHAHLVIFCATRARHLVVRLPSTYGRKWLCGPRVGPGTSAECRFWLESTGGGRDA